MDYAKRNRQISNGYYNLGLEKAQMRDLSGAVYCLKKSLHFHKYNTQSRNLLGLVYYEIGEVADALLQWVLSMNLQPEGNTAGRYINDLQNTSGRLEVLAQTIKKYNQALMHAQHGSEDLAILQLSKAVEENPNFIKAHLLLANLYILHGDYGKAKKSLAQILKIDHQNVKATAYLSALRGPGVRITEGEKKKPDYALSSHRKMQDDDVIIPSTYRENSGWQSVINIMVGLVLGVAVIYFLVMPANTKAVNHKHNQEMLTYYDTLNQRNIEVEQLRTQVEQLQEQYDSTSLEVQNISDNSGYVLRQYQTLIQMLEAYQNDNFQQVVLLYHEWDIAAITDEASQPIAARIDQDVKENGYQVLQDLGNRARDRGEQEAAIDYYRRSLNIKGDNAQVIFDLAVIYNGMEETEVANDLFGQVILNFPNSDLATQAREIRGY